MKRDISGVVVSVVGLPLLWYAVAMGWLNWLIIICVVGTIVASLVGLTMVIGHWLIKALQQPS